MLSFGEFVDKYNDGTIAEDAAWRAYDIERMATGKHSLQALKLICHTKGELGFSEVGAVYGLSPTRAKILLGFWLVWSNIAEGGRKGRLITRDEQYV